MVKEAKVTYRLQSEEDDIKYWKSKSASDKISIVQILREQYIRIFNKEQEYDESRKRLRRVYRVIK